MEKLIPALLILTVLVGTGKHLMSGRRSEPPKEVPSHIINDTVPVSVGRISWRTANLEAEVIPKEVLDGASQIQVQDGEMTVAVSIIHILKPTQVHLGQGPILRL